MIAAIVGLVLGAMLEINIGFMEIAGLGRTPTQIDSGSE